MQFPVPQKCSALVDSLTHLDGEVYNARFTMQTPANLIFIAGQYGSFVINPTTRRTYSFASLPQDNSSIETCVDLTPRGPGSLWLMSLKQGEVVQFSAPLGRFVVNKENTKRKVFVATGTGISAIRSMILDLLESHNTQPITHNLSLYWGVRHEENMFWDEQFALLAKQHLNFSFTRIVSQPKGEGQDRIGRVTHFVAKEEKDLANSEFYLCGNRQMIYDMKEILIEQGVAEDRIKSELFY